MHLPELPDWIKAVTLSEAQIWKAEFWAKSGDFQRGEAEAMVLATSLAANWFLTDDAAARHYAVLLGLEVHGSLGVYLWNVAKGFLPKSEADDALRKLEESSL